MDGPLPMLGVLALTAVASVFDLKRREIPNAVCGLGLVAAFAMCLLLPGPVLRSLASAALGCLLGLALSLPLWRVGALGGGDVKLLAACGGYIGPLATLQLTAYSLLVFVCFSILSFARAGRLRTSLSASLSYALGKYRPAEQEHPAFGLMPFAPALFLGGGICLLT